MSHPNFRFSEIIATQIDIICFKIYTLLALGPPFFSFLEKCNDFYYRKVFLFAGPAEPRDSPPVHSDHRHLLQRVCFLPVSVLSPVCPGLPHLLCTTGMDFTHFRAFLTCAFKPINFSLNASLVVIFQFSKWPFDLAVNIF